MSQKHKRKSPSLHTDLVKKPSEIIGVDRPKQALPNPSVVTQVQQVKSFTGPLPQPEDFAKYEEIMGGSAERILRMAEAQVKMAESQVQHRIELENNLAACDIRQSDRGLIFGFIIALVIVGGGIWITLTGKNVYGLIAMLAPLATIIGVFIYTRKNPKPAETNKTSTPQPGKTK